MEEGEYDPAEELGFSDEYDPAAGFSGSEYDPATDAGTGSEYNPATSDDEKKEEYDPTEPEISISERDQRSEAEVARDFSRLGGQMTRRRKEWTQPQKNLSLSSEDHLL